MLVEQGAGDRGAVGVAAVERAAADAGGPGDVVHGDGGRVAVREEPLGGGQHLGAVAGGVGPFAGRRAVGQGELGGHGEQR